MAKLTNHDRFPTTLPTGHVIPGAIGHWEGFDFIVTTPGVLETTNDVLRGDNAIRVRMMVAAGSAVEYDDDPPTTVEVIRDEQAMRDAFAASEIARGEVEAKDRDAMYAAMAVEKAAREAQEAAEAALAQAAKDAEAQAMIDAEAALAAPADAPVEDAAPVEEMAVAVEAAADPAPVAKRK